MQNFDRSPRLAKADCNCQHRVQSTREVSPVIITTIVPRNGDVRLSRIRVLTFEQVTWRLLEDLE